MSGSALSWRLAGSAWAGGNIGPPRWLQRHSAWRAVAARLRAGGPSALPGPVARAYAHSRATWAGATPADLRAAADHLRARLQPDDLHGAGGGQALGLAAAALQATLGVDAYATQVRAAWLMLDGALVEMATGEGKTLAAALAAAAAALAGLPVHVLTANDYLVQRDRDAMAPMFDLLGLRSAGITAALPRAQRRAAWRHDIVYATGRELVFDHLKDHVALQGERDARVLRARSLGASPGSTADSPHEAVLPPLRLALVDEADSLLLDEACMPFVLAGPGAAPDLPALQAARELAAQLAATAYRLHLQQRDAQLTPAGSAQLQRAVQAVSPLWPLRQAQALVRAALVAQHLLLRDRDYTVCADGVVLIDAVTGRTAPGRQWTGPLQALVALKEGLLPGPAAATVARITYQRFLPRYQRLGGMSGTLREASGELRSSYRCPVRRLPLHRPTQARWLGTRCLATSARRWQAVAVRVQALVATGRPVLVGTDSVAASQALSAVLAGQGIAHQVLNAVQDADEAALVARAGVAGRVTVTTNIAGRDTDIRLDAAARAAGGLHVILALANRARRIDRQLLGRAARHGEPGSAECLLALDDSLLTCTWPRPLLRWLAAHADAAGTVPGWFARPLLALAQRRAEWADRLLRRDLHLADASLRDSFAVAGGTE
jgi:preprotein translocase subunit SecA